VRQISARFLSQDERIEIADLHHAGLSIRQIAHRLFLLLITMGVLAAYCGPVSPATALFVVFLFSPWGNATFLMAIITVFAWIAAIAVRLATHQRSQQDQ
jgi:hypothetical protein